MKKLFAAAALMSAIAFGGAIARDAGSSTRSYDHVEVVYMNGHADMGMFGEKISPDNATKQQAQKEIRKDPSLRKVLLRHDVELKNVMAIDKARTRETTIYVR
ncbi:hypothetical protein E2F50_01535 [Rhizobium deserti]|uniref:Uncharacterized protein n=1 Tax=Rhizobium deserti TaxID=2547961 RepID=A0A4R5UM07_9HYPH|nr:hypothetical protein [Rhizobium deserti]TDK38851.1 hypothetical protein E2F50_01535 [Rhizobium deserti]